MPNKQGKKPIVILGVIEPGTMGDLSFIDKMVDSYQGQQSDQPFLILLNDLGDSSLNDNSLVQDLKRKIGEENVQIVHIERDQYHEIAEAWKLEEVIARVKPKAIVYGPMIIAEDCSRSKRIADVNNVPFIVIPEYSYPHFGANVILTGPGPQANGMFLGDLLKNEALHSKDEKKLGKSLAQLEGESQIFLSYLNNHSSGRGANPQKFKQELLSYLYFVTGTLASSDNLKPAEIFCRIKDDIFNAYLQELQQNNPYDCSFELNYNGITHHIPGKNVGNGNLVKINLSNPFPLEKESMVALMQACKRQQNPVCATGDQSLSETISIGVPFFYQVMPWKKDLAKDLDSTATIKGLTGVSEMNKEGFSFMSLGEAKSFAKKYNENKGEWAEQYASLKQHIPDLYQVLPEKIDRQIHANSKLGYEHRARVHMFSVRAEKFNDLKSSFNDMKGDALKAHILAEIKDKIAGAPNAVVLNMIVNGFRSSSEYRVLQMGQGTASKIFSLETSSIKEFNTLVKNAKKQFEPNAKGDEPNFS